MPDPEPGPVQQASYLELLEAAGPQDQELGVAVIMLAQGYSWRAIARRLGADRSRLRRRIARALCRAFEEPFPKRSQ